MAGLVAVLVALVVIVYIIIDVYIYMLSGQCPCRRGEGGGGETLYTWLARKQVQVGIMYIHISKDGVLKNKNDVYI